MEPILFAKRFVAGTTLSDAMGAAEKLGKLGIKSTLDHLGEDVTSRTNAKRATHTYINMLKKIKTKKLDANIAIKLSQVGLAIDKQLALENTEKILRTAKSMGLIVEIDMEGSKYVEDTVNIYLKLVKNYPSTLQALQVYLYRCENDINNIIKAKGRVRLVKGAYNEPEKIAYQDMNKIRQNFRKLIKIYLKKGQFVFIATHDETLINFSKRYIKQNKIPKRKYSFQMLFGTRRDLQEQLATEGHPVRVYIPYGTEWLPYFYRRVMERKENFFFAVRSIFGK